MRVRACRIQGLSKFLRAASVMIWNVLEFQEVTPDFFIYLNEQRSSAHCAGSWGVEGRAGSVGSTLNVCV